MKYHVIIRDVTNEETEIIQYISSNNFNNPVNLINLLPKIVIGLLRIKVGFTRLKIFS